MISKKTHILFLSVVLIIVFLSACGGMRDSFQITAKNWISDENLKINIGVKQAANLGNWTHFATGMDIDELSSTISKKSDVDVAEIFGDEYILIYSKEAHQPFLIKEIDRYETDDENDKRYAFFAPTARFSEENKDVFFPYHYFTDVDIQYYPGYSDINFSEEQMFKTNYDINNIYEFYKNIDIYTTKLISDDTINVMDLNSNNLFTISYDSTEGFVTYSFDEL